jgi:hypothetical protein
VAVYEAEMGPARVKGILLNLGATRDDLRHIRYFKALEDGSVIDLVRHGRAFCKGLILEETFYILYDAMTPLLMASGMNENSSTDIRSFVAAACTPMALASGTVYVIDHTGHTNPGRTRGSSDKWAAGDGEFMLSTVDPFARGRSGSIRLTCRKDRSGQIMAGSCLDIQVECAVDGSLDLKAGSWDTLELREMANPTQQRIREYLVEMGRPVSATRIAQVLDMKVDGIRSALRRGSGRENPIFTQVGKLWEVKTVGRPVG